MGFGLHELSFLSNTVNEIASANDIPSKKAAKKFLADVEEQYDKKLGFESKIDKIKTELSKLGQQELKLLAEINAIPRLGIGVVKLLNLHHDDNKSNSIEQLELLIDQVQKCGGINAALNELGHLEQLEKERHDVETRDETLVLVDYQANKNSSSNEKKIEKEKELLVAARGQDNNHDDDLIEAQSRSMVKKPIEEISPPEPPSFLRHSSSTAIKKSIQPTEHEEERQRERLLGDINKTNSSKEQEEAAQLAGDTLFRLKLDKVLGKYENSPQDTTS